MPDAEDPGHWLVVAHDEEKLVAGGAPLGIGQTVAMRTAAHEAGQVGAAQPVTEQLVQVLPERSAGGHQVVKGEGRSPVGLAERGEELACLVGTERVEDGPGDRAALQGQHIHGASRVLPRIQVLERHAQHGIPDLRTGRDGIYRGVDDRPARRPVREERLQGRADRLADVRVEQVGGEVAAGIRDQAGGEGLHDEVERQGLRASGRRLVDEEVACRPHEHVTTGEVVGEERPDSVPLGPREAALAIAKVLRIAESRIKACGGKAHLTHQQHRRRGQCGVHPPAARVAAQGIGHFHQGQAIVGVAQAGLPGLAQAFLDPGLDLAGSVSQDLEVPGVLGVDQDLHEHAVDLDGPALEPGSDQSHRGHRSRRGEAEPGATGRARRVATPSRTGGEPAAGQFHGEVDIEEIHRAASWVVSILLGSRRRDPAHAGHQSDEAPVEDGALVPQEKQLPLKGLHGLRGARAVCQCRRFDGLRRGRDLRGCDQTVE